MARSSIQPEESLLNCQLFSLKWDLCLVEIKQVSIYILKAVILPDTCMPFYHVITTLSYEGCMHLYHSIAQSLYLFT